MSPGRWTLDPWTAWTPVRRDRNLDLLGVNFAKFCQVLSIPFSVHLVPKCTEMYRKCAEMYRNRIKTARDCT